VNVDDPKPLQLAMITAVKTAKTTKLILLDSLLQERFSYKKMQKWLRGGPEAK
jgi:hypothetical protein